MLQIGSIYTTSGSGTTHYLRVKRYITADEKSESSVVFGTNIHGNPDVCTLNKRNSLLGNELFDQSNNTGYAVNYNPDSNTLYAAWLTRNLARPHFVLELIDQTGNNIIESVQTIFPILKP